MKKVSFNHLGNRGRLGNCMFQYATVLGAARSSGKHQPVCNLSAVPLMMKYFVLGSVEDGRNEENFLMGIEKEGHFGFNEMVLMLPEDKNIDLYGYFQTEKHFKHIEQEIRQNFTFTEAATIPAAQKIPSDQKELTVSLHVRRGDYVNFEAVHPCLPIEYYTNALTLFPEHRPVVFSDDIDWCKETLKDVLKNPIFIDGEEIISKDGRIPSDETAYVDMCAMSMCDGHIIANSSFSWWGAWLGGGKTIAPKNWFGSDGPQNWQDIYCDGWTVL